MSERDDGGQAFPKLEREWDQDDRRYHYSMAEGATLRDFFAAHSLPLAGMVAFAGVLGTENPNHVPDEKIARQAFAIADAMLAERAK